MRLGKRNCTAKELASRLGISVSTVKKYTSIPRAEYLATHTLYKDAPWEAEGICRATWYNRRKRVQK
jgi:transcriptional regulator with XRE-family HTH domain